MQEKGKKFYEPPALTVVNFKVERGYAESGLKLIIPWFYSGKDAWDGSSSGGGNSIGSGWTDNGGSAWEN